MNEKILVVDDEPLILITIERALGKQGYDVVTTGDAEDFLGHLAKHEADLLIMDVNLDGINSETLLDNIKDLAPDVKILFISGVIPELKLQHFLEKPFKIDTLRDKVRQILDS